jgi:hypothetical protein
MGTMPGFVLKGKIKKEAVLTPHAPIAHGGFDAFMKMETSFF